MTGDWTYIVWALMALVLVGTGVARVRRQMPENSRAPGVLMSALIWLGVIVLLVLIIQGASLWTDVGSLFR